MHIIKKKTEDYCKNRGLPDHFLAKIKGLIGPILSLIVLMLINKYQGLCKIQLRKARKKKTEKIKIEQILAPTERKFN